MYKSDAEKFLNWLYYLFCYIARFLVASALVGACSCPVVNRILWECNLPTLPFWWYWFLFMTLFVLRMLCRKGMFDDDN